MIIRDDYLKLTATTVLVSIRSKQSSSESSIANEAMNVMANEEFKDLPNMFNSSLLE